MVRPVITKLNSFKSQPCCNCGNKEWENVVKKDLFNHSPKLVYEGMIVRCRHCGLVFHITEDCEYI